MNGTLSILNVGEGDTTLTFDKKNPKERERAAKIVTDMLRQGYALLVQVGTRKGEPTYQRVKEFDPQRCEYVIASGPDETVDIGKEPEEKVTKKKIKKKTRRIPAGKTKAVAMGRSAGG